MNAVNDHTTCVSLTRVLTTRRASTTKPDLPVSVITSLQVGNLSTLDLIASDQNKTPTLDPCGLAISMKQNKLNLFVVHFPKLLLVFGYL